MPTKKPEGKLQKNPEQILKNPELKRRKTRWKTREICPRNRFGFAAPRIQDTKAKAALFEK
jgi:hypothetical protein